MTFSAGFLRQTLASFAEHAAAPDRFVVAFSGGLDSAVLLHALATSRDDSDTRIIAVHVDHGLQPDSACWAEHCRSFATSLGVEFAAVNVQVDTGSGRGPEAAARDARYGAFRELVEPGDWLLSAHHRDDLAETVLINLLRGSGPRGLAGIPALRRFASGWLLRPLLDVSREELLEYGRAHALEWLEDPSNIERQFDRNFLRHEVLPRLDERWPDAASRIGRSAELAAEAADLLRELASLDMETAGDRADRVRIDELMRLTPARQRNLLRHIVADLGLPPAGARHLEQITAELLLARQDSQPLVAWPGARARRYRNRLYLMPAGDDTDRPQAGTRVANDGLSLGRGLGRLRLRADAQRGLSDDLVARGLALHYRTGGEEIKPAGQSHTRKLKKLLQERNVVPWMRDRLPLLYAGDRLVAVGDLWIADDAASEPGTAVEWINRPAID